MRPSSAPVAGGCPANITRECQRSDGEGMAGRPAYHTAEIMIGGSTLLDDDTAHIGARHIEREDRETRRRGRKVFIRDRVRGEGIVGRIRLADRQSK